MLKKQKILEDKVIQLQNDVHLVNNSVTEKDFIEISKFLKNFTLL